MGLSTNAKRRLTHWVGGVNTWLRGLDLAFAEHGATVPRAPHEQTAEMPQTENRQLRSQRYCHEALGKRFRTAFKPHGGNAGMADVAPAGAFCPERMPRSSTASGPQLTVAGGKGWRNAIVKSSHSTGRRKDAYSCAVSPDRCMHCRASSLAGMPPDWVSRQSIASCSCAGSQASAP
jgi:hypothetical protein